MTFSFRQLTVIQVSSLCLIGFVGLVIFAVNGRKAILRPAIPASLNAKTVVPNTANPILNFPLPDFSLFTLPSGFSLEVCAASLQS